MAVVPPGSLALALSGVRTRAESKPSASKSNPSLGTILGVSRRLFVFLSYCHYLSDGALEWLLLTLKPPSLSECFNRRPWPHRVLSRPATRQPRRDCASGPQRHRLAQAEGRSKLRGS